MDYKIISLVQILIMPVAVVVELIMEEQLVQVVPVVVVQGAQLVDKMLVILLQQILVEVEVEQVPLALVSLVQPVVQEL